MRPSSANASSAPPAVAKPVATIQAASVGATTEAVGVATLRSSTSPIESLGSQHGTRWSVLAGLETSFLDELGFRVGLVLSGALHFGRLSIHSGLGYLATFDTSGDPGFAGGGRTYQVRRVLPDDGLLGRLGLAWRLWRTRSLELLLGTSAEVEYSGYEVIAWGDTLNGSGSMVLGANLLPWLEARLGTGRLRPVVRVGWRQPLIPFDVELYGEKGYAER